MTKIKVTKNFKITIVVILIALFSWAGFTKARYIENYFGIEILCSESKITTQNLESNPVDQLNEIANPSVAWKPVIYLYPQAEMNILVELNFKGKIVADYPKYNRNINGWNVIAYPDGRLMSVFDNQEYSYIFWEGRFDTKINWDLSTGFTVKGADTIEFLQKTLAQIGLTPKEYNEFIVYWYPLMMINKYNLIHFADKQYTETAPLTTSPKPDSMLRVFMVYKPLSKHIEVEPQFITPFERKGFTVVEWGGTEIK